MTGAHPVPALETIKKTTRGTLAEEGPVRAEGANGLVTSVFIRDPDGNLIEVASYDSL